MNITQLDKALHTVKYMTPRQWFYRLYYVLAPAPRVLPPQQLKAQTLHLGFGSSAADTAAADNIRRLEFPLVSGFVARFDREVDWDLPQTDYRLQCFRLNSFDFLHCLSDAFCATGDSRYIDFGYTLIAHWQAHCGRIQGDKWNPYPLAQRICNWIGFVSAYPRKDLESIAGFVRYQAQVLAKRVEYHLGANHLLTQGKALMYAGSFTREDTLYRRGKQLLADEFATQFLADGGHYEGSLSYHIESTQQYLEAVLLMEHQKDPDWLPWARNLEKPYCYLSGLLGANGTIPLYNDSAFDYCVEARDFLATSGLIFDTPAPGSVPGPYFRRWQAVACALPVQWAAPQTRLYRESGLYVDHFDCHSFYLRCGQLGPDCNLGHAHADQLSILWQTAEGEILADSGVFTYQAGALRTACRETAAHNTVEIDGNSSAQVWGAFRTARRGHAAVTDHRGSCVSAMHDGYRKILGDGILHERSYCRSGSTVTITDTLTAKRKNHTATMRYHLAPSCRAEPLDDHRVLLKGKYILECSHPIILEPCKVAGKFGMVEDSLCISASWQFSEKSIATTTFHL